MKQLDINCDLGESYGHFRVGNDEAVFPYITSCNIACGQHGGDPLTMEKTILLAKKHQVQIGAHPSYPDLAGFGRRKMQLTAIELKALVRSQIALIDGLAKSHQQVLKYVKAHGALYNSLADNTEEAKAFVEAITSYNDQLAVMGLAGSALAHAAQEAGIQFIREGFIDRRYTDQGRLAPRDQEGAVLKSIPAMLQQFEQLAIEGQVTTQSGKQLSMEVDSLCIHGDNPAAAQLLVALHQKAKEIAVILKKHPL